MRNIPPTIFITSLRDTTSMNTKQSMPMSPSSSTTSTPCSTQAPTSIKESLPYGIFNAEKWNREYNYESLPRIHEDKFWGVLIEVAGDTNPAGIEFESKVGSVMEQRKPSLARNSKNKRTRSCCPRRALSRSVPEVSLLVSP